MSETAETASDIITPAASTGSEEHDNLLETVELKLSSVWQEIKDLVPWHAAEGQAASAENGIKAAYDSAAAAVKADAERVITQAAADTPEALSEVEKDVAPVAEAVESAAEHL